jgi:site-specific recombinase XerD
MYLWAERFIPKHGPDERHKYMKRWDGMVEGYLKQCEFRGLSEATITGLRNELDHWGCWLKRRRPKPNLEEVDGLMLIEYIRSRTRFHAKSTVSGVTSKMRCMGEYLLQEGIWKKNPMRWVRGPRLDPRGRLPRRIGKEHLTKIWDATRENRSTYQKHLSIAVLALLYGTGLRRGELVRLDVDHWKREEGIIQIDGRKTGCERNIPVSEGIRRCLEAYLPLRHNLLEKRGVSRERAMFLNRDGHRMSSERVGMMVHRLAKVAKVPLVSLHQFRHTCASDLLENGVSLPEVQQMLGQATVVTTTRYLQISDVERARAIKKHPLNDYLDVPARLQGRAA